MARRMRDSGSSGQSLRGISRSAHAWMRTAGASLRATPRPSRHACASGSTMHAECDELRSKAKPLRSERDASCFVLARSLPAAARGSFPASRRAGKLRPLGVASCDPRKAGDISRGYAVTRVFLMAAGLLCGAALLGCPPGEQPTRGDTDLCIVACLEGFQYGNGCSMTGYVPLFDADGRPRRCEP